MKNKKHMPQYQTTHIWQITCQNIKQLTYENNTCHTIRQLTYEKHMPHYKTTHIFKGGHATIWDNSHEKTHATI